MQAFEPFLAAIPNEKHRARTREVLAHVHKTFPELDMEVKWGQPMFLDHGTFIISFSVAAAHLAVAPETVTLERFEEPIREAGYSATKMLFRIKWNQEVNWALLEDMIRFNIQDKKGSATFWRKPQ